jgi:hypothetical protein
MSDQTKPIPKNPQLPNAEDYRTLRAEGFRAIEELGSQQWTDYNAHDPGITILEALTYALSELGYRSGFDIADILTESSGYISFRQALFSARRILTNNPLTVQDFRKVLIDLPNIRNGWLLCKECVCESKLYAECADSKLYHAPQWRLKPQIMGRNPSEHEHPIIPKGLYDVLLQLELDPELGDLNNRKVIQTLNITLLGSEALAPLTIELRFPDWANNNPDLYELFTSSDPSFTISNIETTISRDSVTGEPVTEESFVRGWRNVFFANYTITFEVGGSPYELVLEAVPVRFFSTQENVKRVPGILDIVSTVLRDSQMGGLMDRYRRKLLAVAKAVKKARHALHNIRNLAEDFCRFESIRCQDIAFCADVELEADADIENVLAQIYHQIDSHFNPSVPFYTLSEMTATGLTTEEIFEGPALENGFIRDEDLEASHLRSVVHISELYERLMDIPGVVTIKNVQFTRYNDQGQALSPAHQWTIPILPLHIPTLYQEASRVLFYKDGLPFVARMDEMKAILAQIQGENLQAKVPLSERDYPVPVGKHRKLALYHPVQHTFPLTYGIGPAGLPPNVSELRRAQARQLKGYLLPYEQLIADMTEQLAHTPDLFSTDEKVDRTYFTHFFDPTSADPEIAQLPDLLTAEATEENLRTLAEPRRVFYDRRNRFLDHMLARFGEHFSDYALLLNTNEDRLPFAPKKLIRDKIRFLRFYPDISARRSKAFNFRDENRICDPLNRLGIADRIARLLGLEMLKGYFNVEIINNLNQFQANFTLSRPEPSPPTILLRQEQPIGASTGEAAEEAAWRLIGDIISNGTKAANYVMNDFGNVIIQDPDGNTLAVLETGISPDDVIGFITDILAKERLFVIEHLLLRPKFPGDAIMPVCLDPECNLCGEEDPYSFHLTYILQGALEPFSVDIDLRRFADQTIRRETPAHLLPKVCWVGNQGFEKDDCTPVLSRLIELLQQYLNMDLEADVTCNCSHEVYDGFHQLFQPWIEPQELIYRPPGIWKDDLQQVFGSLSAADFPCLNGIDTAGWDEIFDVMLDHFLELAINMHQFDRLEKVWCVWLEANAPFLWQGINETLRARTEFFLRESLEGLSTTEFCRCAELLLGYFGDQFRKWIDHLVDTEADLTDQNALRTAMKNNVWDPFIESLPTILRNDPDFCQLTLFLNNDNSATILQDLWLTNYSEWITVSYRLNILIRVLSDLRSNHPTATLHDCDDGSDDNPVRLDNTTLGTL